MRRNWVGGAGWVAAVSVVLLTGCQRDGGAAGRTQASSTGAASTRSTAAAEAAGGESEPALSDIVQLTSGFPRAGEAYFSHDAKWIIFQAAPQGEQHYQMYVARLRWQGGGIVGLDQPVRISPPNSRNTCGYFSPDGKSLIFASTAGKEDPNEPAAGYQRQGGSYRWDFPNGMEIFRADDWRPKVEQALSTFHTKMEEFAQKTGGTPHDSYISMDLAKNPITQNDAYDAEGAYSPNGKWIVFGSRRGGDSELYVMRPDGTDVVQLTNAKGYDGGPFFSPDGKRIVYRSDRKGNDLLQIFTADLTFAPDGQITGSANERQLTDDPNVNWGPYWYPDGRHLIYATSAHGHQNYELYWMRDDGSGKTRVTHKDGFDGLPVFSPDGKWLMWSSKRTTDNTTQIFAARFTPPGDTRAR
jgi:Tol biopolymer transport system component